MITRRIFAQLLTLPVLMPMAKSAFAMSANRLPTVDVPGISIERAAKMHERASRAILRRAIELSTPVDLSSAVVKAGRGPSLHGEFAEPDGEYTYSWLRATVMIGKTEVHHLGRITYSGGEPQPQDKAVERMSNGLIPVEVDCA